MANTFNLGNGNWAQKTEKLLAYNAENNNYKPLPFDFDRGSTATRVNKNGLIETVGVDEPRIDFINNPKGHLLLEPQRRNDIPYSEDINSWTKISSTISSNDTISPDGTQNADKLTSTANFARITQNLSLSSSTTYTISFYVKNISAVNPRVNIFDTTNGVVLNSTYYGSLLSTTEWKRLEYQFTTTTAASVNIEPVRDLNSAEEMYIWGIQLEAGSYATSYIPTSGSAVTRSAETCNITGLETNAMNGATEGTLFVDLEFEKESNGDAMRWRSSTSNAGRGYFYATQMGFADTYGVNGVVTFGLTQNSTIKAAFRLNSLSNATVFLNGTKGGTGNGNTWANIGQLLLNSTYWKMKINEIKMYNTALSDSELIALTTI